MKKYIAVLLSITMLAATSITASAATRSIYSNLNWYYPCPGEYGVYITYNPPSHYGLDIAAPNDSDICSVDDGTVVCSGYHDSTGYYVVVSNDTRLSGVSNPLYTRYLHMDYSPDVSYNERVERGDRLGGVGSSGDYVGSEPVDHLHFDVNTGKYTGGGNFTSSNTIDPELFWPDIDFDYLNRRSAYAIEQEEPITMDKFIDTTLIQYVGEDNFDQWVNSNQGNVSVDSFKDHFGISDAQFDNLIEQFGLQEIYGNI